MKVPVERAELLKSLGHGQRGVERRNTIPILANVLIKADKGSLSLKATDLDLEVTDTMAGEVGPGGATTVPAHMFYDIVRKLPEGSQIVIEGSGDRAVLSIRAGRSRFTLQTLPESDFPDLAAGEMTHSFKLAAADPKRRRQAGHHRAAQDGRRSAAPDRNRRRRGYDRTLRRQDPLHHRQRG